MRYEKQNAIDVSERVAKSMSEVGVKNMSEVRGKVIKSRGPGSCQKRKEKRVLEVEV